MKQPAQRYVVWMCGDWHGTWAVSPGKAQSNVEWRMRRQGKFPVRSEIEVRLVKPGEDVKWAR